MKPKLAHPDAALVLVRKTYLQIRSFMRTNYEFECVQ
jgi:hypothetical protein